MNYSPSVFLLRICLIIGLLVTGNTGFAQKFKPRIYIKEASNYSTLYANYLKNSFEGSGCDYKFSLADAEIYDQLAKQIPPDKLDYVIAYNDRKNYPPDMQRTEWVDATPIQKNAILYYMARFNHGACSFILVEFPAAENAQNPGLREDQRPRSDIYFVIDDHFLKDVVHYMKDSIAGNMYNTKGWYGSYTKAEAKIREKLIANFDAFYNVTDRYIDTSFYFKTIVPVPHYTREQYITHQVTQSPDSEKKALLVLEQKKLTEEIVQAEKVLIDLYKQHKWTELLTHYPLWECEHMNLDTTKERPKGDLRGPIPMLMTVRAKLHFTTTGIGVDMLTDEIIAAQEDYGSAKAEEYFTSSQHFSMERGKSVLVNEDYKNNRNQYSYNFDKPPYDFFRPVVNLIMNDFVVPEFSIGTKEDLVVFLVFKTAHLGMVEFYPAQLSAQMTRLKVINKQLSGMN